MAATGASATSDHGNSAALPSGLHVFISFPDALMITDFIFGGLVWILVASTRLTSLVEFQGWVMFVSIFCFVITLVLIVLYIMGAHGGQSSWITLDTSYQCIAALLYLSAAVSQAIATRYSAALYSAAVAASVATDVFYKSYQENIAAVVFAYLATLSYVIHAVGSLMRWKKAS